MRVRRRAIKPGLAAAWEPTNERASVPHSAHYNSAHAWQVNARIGFRSQKSSVISSQLLQLGSLSHHYALALAFPS